MATKIEWTDETINPLRARDKQTGKVGHFCEMVSPGCVNCYASRMQTWRFGMHQFHRANRDKVELWLDESKLDVVRKWRTPRMIFWCDMTDMFYSGYPTEWIDRIFETMESTPQHIHQVLTKRATRMRWYFYNRYATRDDGAPPNIWAGVSIENNDYAAVDYDRPADDPGRIGHLANTPAARQVPIGGTVVGTFGPRVGGTHVGWKWLSVGLGGGGWRVRPGRPIFPSQMVAAVC